MKTLYETMEKINKHYPTQQQRDDIAVCFERMANSFGIYSDDGKLLDKINLAAKDGEHDDQIEYLIQKKVMTPPRLALILLGLQKLLSEIGEYIEIDELINYCNSKSKNETGLMMPIPDKKKKASSPFPMV